MECIQDVSLLLCDRVCLGDEFAVTILPDQTMLHFDFECPMLVKQYQIFLMGDGSLSIFIFHFH